ncbi:MAG: choice-of-anchor J domain-containing protein [Prevotella sp.]|nr:choice-of-anchor J domain-containing protein [Prevotella sp.]
MNRKLHNPFLARAVMTILAVLACLGTVRADEVTIGDGGTSSSAFLPTFDFYNYSLTQQIYTATELGAAGTITSIAFKNTTDGTDYTRNLKVYIQHSDKEQFSGGDWVPMSESDLVFSGDVTFTVGEWVTIDFDTPFVYDGSSNIILCVADNTGSYQQSPHIACLTFTFSAESMAIYAYRDDGSYDVTAPGVNGTVSNAKNQILLVKGALPTCLKPSGLALVGEPTYNSAQLSWTPGSEGQDAWQLCLNGDESNPIDANSNPFTLTNLTAETAYTVKVRANCGGGDVSSWSDEISFTTPEQFLKPTDVSASNITINTADVSWTGDAPSYNLRYRTFTEGDQVMFEGFEGLDSNALPEGWTTIDADGDGQAWYIFTPNGNEDKYGNPWVFDESCATSASYNNGALTPDNWLVTPQIELNGMMHVWLRAQDPDWTYENFAIYLSTTGANVADFTTVLVPETSATGEYVEFTVDLSEYAGQRGYIAFRHFDCTDMFRLNVDNFSINSVVLGDWMSFNDVQSPFILDALAENTGYQVQVQGVYADGQSQWTGTTFKTLSTNPIATDVTVTPSHTSAEISWTGSSDSYEVKYRTAAHTGDEIFFEDFESGIGDWTTSNTVGGSGVLDGVGVDGGSCFGFSYTTTPPQYLISPELSITEEALLCVSCKNYTTSYGVESFKLGYSTSTNSIDDFTWGNKINVSNDTDWHIYKLAVPAGTKYVSVQCTSNNVYYLLVDNISINEIIPATEWNTVNTTETSVELTGLEMDTEYEYQIIGIKNGTPNEGTEIASFTTLGLNNKIFTTAGNWDDADNWYPVGVPAASADVTIKADAIIPSGVVATAKNVEIDGGSLTIKDGGQLIHYNEGVVATIEKNIKGYGDSERGGYYLLTVPIVGSVEPGDIAGMTDGDYDLYAFDFTQDGEQWQNFKTTNFVLSKGYSYLYANKNDVTLSFTGELIPMPQTGYVHNVTGYNTIYTTDKHLFANWNLVGNPHPFDAFITLCNYNNGLSIVSPAEFYTLNAAGDEIVPAAATTGVTSGLFVVAQASTNRVYSGGVQYEENAATEPSFMVLPQHGLISHQSAAPVFVLESGATDNQDVISTYNGYSGLNIQLGSRTLYADGNWNTLTVPFDVTLSESPLAGAIAKTVTGASLDGKTLNITFGPAVDELEAGVPYIIRWTSGDDLVSPVFNNVTIDATVNNFDNGASGDNNVCFKGNYNALTYSDETNSIYYMGPDNGLYHPNGQGDAVIKALSAYFELGNGINLAGYSLDFGDGETTGIRTIGTEPLMNDGAWYTLDGRKLNGIPVQKGVYINNGRKVVLK